jgi:hypothetical protein
LRDKILGVDSISTQISEYLLYFSPNSLIIHKTKERARIFLLDLKRIGRRFFFIEESLQEIFGGVDKRGVRTLFPFLRAKMFFVEFGTKGPIKIYRVPK